MPNLKEVREYFLSELDGSSAETRRVRLFWCDQFLKFARNKALTDWDKQLVSRFRAKLEEEKYTPTTIRNVLGIVKRIFDAATAVHEKERSRLIASADPKNPSAVADVLKAMSLPGPRWDVGKRFMPEVTAANITKPEMAKDDLLRMVEAARGGKLSPPEVAFLAISSIYGFRAGELRAVLPEHINYDEQTLWRQTEKGGEKRNQALATCIIPYLQKYDFSLDYSPYMINKVFHSICTKAGVTTVWHQAWHSMRHRVLVDVRDTFAGLPELKMEPRLIANIFLCWKQSTSSEMTDRYYTKSPLEVDKMVLEHSPLVKMWS